MNIPARLETLIKAAGVAITAVSVPDLNKATWKVYPTSLQAAAQPTIDAFNPADPAQITADQTAQFLATSRQKDILTTCALIVRARGIATWNGMTVQQKKDAALAEADVWQNIRAFVEDNL